MNDLPYYLHCYRNEDGLYPLKVGQDYHPVGQGGLSSQNFMNPYSGNEYISNPEGELGFCIEAHKYGTTGQIVEYKWIYFSEDPNSDIFYGKWFFDDIEYTHWIREYKLKHLLEKEKT